ncbi:hypothetical protein [Mucilaginibacter sp.]|uniref:hypothetical protein n=1 Tax=Mucilaginibacter sp. TaxID=1882438 RepID=UPI002840E612|nr:hypothetical protein [Mucilaginibacter sp.]MDR3693537.1 hypothetical protein [Mucilaginibacter sp.]
MEPDFWIIDLKPEQLLLIAPFTIFYLLVVLVGRWKIMALPYRRHFEVETNLILMEVQEYELILNTYPDLANNKAEIESLFKKVYDLLFLASAEAKKRTLRDYYCWGGEEFLAWHYAKAADRLFIKIRTDHCGLFKHFTMDELVDRLKEELTELKLSKNTNTNEIIKETERYINTEKKSRDSGKHIDKKDKGKSCDDDCLSDHSIKLEGALLLKDVLLIHHNSQLQNIDKDLKNNNKLMWFITTSLFLITILGWLLGNPILFLAGGIGGFFSRLRYILKAENATTSFLGNWMNLFSSPSVGALAGWVGVLLIYVTKVSVLDINPFKNNHHWMLFHGRPLYEAFAIAFLFGFSERLFDTFMNSEKLNGTENSNKEKDKTSENDQKKTIKEA